MNIFHGYKENILPPAFFMKPTVLTAQELLGKILVRTSPEGAAAGRIVETEAYLSADDPACHAARGRTRRNAVMFGPAGRAYVYLIYGMHYCFNAVTGSEGEGEAVLVRALEPLYGLELMARRRRCRAVRQLASGPGKLCRAMAIGAAENGLSLQREPLYLTDDGFRADSIVTAKRIGLTQGTDLPLRFYLRDNLFISGK